MISDAQQHLHTSDERFRTFGRLLQSLTAAVGPTLKFSQVQHFRQLLGA
jgi:hypothetical protein